MTSHLDAAYRLLDLATHAVDDLGPGTVAHFEQHAAAMRTVLHLYGIDLDQPQHRHAIVAVVDLLTRAPAGPLTVLADLQQTLIAATRTADRSST